MNKPIAMLALLVLLALPATAKAWNADETISVYLKNHYPWARTEVSDLQLEEAPPAAPPRAVWVEKNIPGRAIFTFVFAHGKRIRATALVKAFDPVVLSRRPLDKGEVLSKDDLYTALMNIVSMPKGTVSSDAELVGKQLSRAISANLPITDVMVSSTRQAKKGRKVTLIAEAPGFTVRTAGELMQNCFVGNYAKVVNLASHKMVSGLLIDEQTVKVGL
jgi:flagella basal body P-ring formation protein FlgA